MFTYVTKSINMSLDCTPQQQQQKVCNLLGVTPKDVISLQLHKQSIDARNKNNVHFVCSFVVQCNKRLFKNVTPYEFPTDVLQTAQKKATQKSCIVVGSGPAGLFCASYLSQIGCKVTLVERGGDVAKRTQAIQHFNNGGDLDENCNVQFGLGGAGTFSDGKLTTGISSPLTYTVFQHFVRHGAPKDILTNSLPHIGTDNLVKVVDSIKNQLQQNGATVLFDTLVTNFVVENGVCKGVTVQNGQQKYNIFADFVVVACGHSARDIFAELHSIGANLQFKPFAVGVRVEHSREFINQSQYGLQAATHKDLPSASYKLVNQCSNGHGCYSFCMCPGGTVVCGSSQKNTVVVNGMSNYARNAPNSNSAIVFTVSAEDVQNFGFGNDVFSGVRFQQSLEQLCFQVGGNYSAPCQNVTDFLQHTTTTQLQLTPSYPRGVTLANLWDILPTTICNCIAESLVAFDNKIKGFGTSGVLTAVETRTSSPIRIVRGDTYESNIANLYPCGEGAGYAGGIVSSAVDGLKVAMQIEKLL